MASATFTVALPTTYPSTPLTLPASRPSGFSEGLPPSLASQAARLLHYGHVEVANPNSKIIARRSTAKLP